MTKLSDGIAGKSKYDNQFSVLKKKIAHGRAAVLKEDKKLQMIKLKPPKPYMGESTSPVRQRPNSRISQPDKLLSQGRTSSVARKRRNVQQA